MKTSTKSPLIILDATKITELRKTEVLAKLDRAVKRMELNLSDKVSEAKEALETHSHVTNLEGFDANKWIDQRNSLINTLKLAEAKLSNFEENFS